MLYYFFDLEVNYDNLVNYNFIVFVDNMGLEENLIVGVNCMKLLCGIMNYGIFDEIVYNIVMVIDWKLMGNWKGEYYVDKVRGFLNEGGLFVERMGYYFLGVLLFGDILKNLFKDGFDKLGVGFWFVKLMINWDRIYDMLLSFVF